MITRKDQSNAGNLSSDQQSSNKDLILLVGGKNVDTGEVYNDI
jgi:hypothetical protein